MNEAMIVIAEDSSNNELKNINIAVRILAVLIFEFKNKVPSRDNNDLNQIKLSVLICQLFTLPKTYSHSSLYREKLLYLKKIILEDIYTDAEIQNYNLFIRFLDKCYDNIDSNLKITLRKNL